MDSIYNNKKYLQTLNAADYYRGNTTLRPSVSRMRSRFPFRKQSKANSVCLQTREVIAQCSFRFNLLLIYFLNAASESRAVFNRIQVSVSVVYDSATKAQPRELVARHRCSSAFPLECKLRFFCFVISSTINSKNNKN